MTRATGHVKFFKEPAGYGFIKPEDGSPDVFVHRTSIDDETCRADHSLTLAADQYVSFAVVETPKGLKAQHVRAERQQAATGDQH